MKTGHRKLPSGLWELMGFCTSFAVMSRASDGSTYQHAILGNFEVGILWSVILEKLKCIQCIALAVSFHRAVGIRWDSDVLPILSKWGPS